MYCVLSYNLLYEYTVKMLYLVINKVIYGMLKAGLFCAKKSELTLRNWNSSLAHTMPAWQIAR